MLAHLVRPSIAGFFAAAAFLGASVRCSADELTFEREIRPIFKQHCFQCHGDEPEKKGGLDLRTVKRMRAGGESGPAVEPGGAEASLLWRRVASDEMPENPKKVSASQKALLRAWIEAGSPTARPEPDDPDRVQFTDEELDHWSFQAVRRPEIPDVSGTMSVPLNPIDAFVLHRLQAAGIAAFSPAADRPRLIRRATFDLLGLPPTPGEVAAFEADAAPDAYERLIDRLLASSAYGERWGRHWLDLAGYAETDGGPRQETERASAWRYRDYVVNSLNSDKPYDIFVQEQLAGDELADRPLDPQNPRTRDLLTATGFLRMAPDPTQTSNSLADRNQAVADVIKVSSTSLLGLTIGCAQCHNHKYDPISAEDYYRFRAIFDPAFNLQQWQQPAQRQLDVTPPDVVAAADAIESQAVEQDRQLREEMTAGARQVQDREVARVPAPDGEAARAAAETKPAERTLEQQALLLKYPNVKPIDFIRGFFVEYDKTLHAKFKKREEEIATLRRSKPARQFVMYVDEPVAPAPESHVLFRGDPEQPQAVVTPGEVAILNQNSECEIPLNTDGVETTGRRLAYARWITSGQHPLTARVLVNQLWTHHFGRGLVTTPGDFGLNGELPSHPELLDWLAVDFVNHGWSLKRLHRLMMTSAAYRQSSARREDLDRVDMDNRLLGRMNLRRLEAEAVRDALLAASGQLTAELGGPSVPVTEDGEGKAVFGQPMTNEGLFSGVTETGRAADRRSLYVQSRRALPLAMLDTFDLPAMTPNCDLRRNSTVATQSLMFLNDQMIWHFAETLAARVRNDSPTPPEQVSQAWTLLFSIPPEPEDLAACVAFLEAQEGLFRQSSDDEWQKTMASQPDAPQLRALASLCQTLMCSNRFLYVD